jgi:hypothetical protein
MLVTPTRRAIHPEPVDRDAMNRRFLKVMLVRSRAECTAGDEEHFRILLVPLASR